MVFHKISPIDDEALIGFIIRLSEINHLSRGVKDLYSAIGLSNSFKNNLYIDENKVTESNLISLCLLARVNLEQLRQLTFSNVFEATENTEIDNLVKMKGFYSSSIKICPKCLLEFGYIRKVWDISLYSVCHIHNCILIERCPKCSALLSTNVNSIKNCRCGFDLSSCETDRLTKRSLEKFLYDKLSGNQIESHILNSLSIKDCLYLLILFATVVHKRFGVVGSLKFVDKKISDIEIFQKTFDIFDNWPNKFKDFLDLYLDIKTNKDSKRNLYTGIVSDFGYFYERIIRTLKAVQFNYIKTEFDNYIINHWEGGHIPAFRKDLRGRSKFITGEEAADLLKLSHPSIINLIEKQSLVGLVRKRGRRVQILVEKNSINNYNKQNKNILTASEVKRILGICSVSIIKLYESNIIQGDKNLINKKTWSFQKSSIDSVLNNFASQALTITNEAPEDLYSFEFALDQFVSTQTRTIVDFINSVLARKLTVYTGLIEAKGLNKYSFSKREVIELLKFERRGFLNRKETAKALKTDPNNIVHWILRGFLEGSATNYKVIVTDEAVKKFIKEYILMGEIAKKINKHPRWALNFLIGNGITPLSGKELDGGLGYIFDREGVETFLETWVNPIVIVAAPT